MLEIIIKSAIFAALLFVAILYYRKTKNAKYSTFRILFGVVLLTMIFSYLIPGTEVTSYSMTNDKLIPLTFANLITNGITALNVSLTTIIYLVSISIFYAVLNGIGAYEKIVENTATAFQKYRSSFIALSVMGLGLFSFFTGELFAAIIFVPFLISVIRKLGYSKEISISSTVGALLLGHAGSLYTFYTNQMLSLTVKDNIYIKLIITLSLLILLIAFLVLCSKKPEKVELKGKVNDNSFLRRIVLLSGLGITAIVTAVLWFVCSQSIGLIVGGITLSVLFFTLIVLTFYSNKAELITYLAGLGFIPVLCAVLSIFFSFTTGMIAVLIAFIVLLIAMLVIELFNKERTLLVYIVMYLSFILLLLGFVPWEQYFEYNGFTEFLTKISEFKIAEVPFVEYVAGNSSSVAPFGSFQLFNAAIIYSILSVYLYLSHTIKSKDSFSNATSVIADGIKKSVPYIVIVVLANTVLVNIFSSGIFYTIVNSFTKGGVTIFNGSLVAILSSVCYPLSMYATQFGLSSIMSSTSMNGSESLIGVLFQSVYSLFLLISPTSILLLLGLHFTGVSYKKWIKHIYKFFIVIVLTAVLIIKINFEGFDLFAVFAILALLSGIIALVYFFVLKVPERDNRQLEKKEEKVEAPKKEVAKAPAKKTTKKTTTKKATKKTTKK